MYKSHGIIGPFQAALTIGAGRSDRKKPVAVRLTFGSDPQGMTIVLNKHTQAIMEAVLAKAGRELCARSVEEAEGQLFERVSAAIPEMRDQFNAHALQFDKVSIDPVRKSDLSCHEGATDFSARTTRHQAKFFHTHDPKVGPDSTYHSHDVDVQFFVAAENEKLKMKPLSQIMRARLQAVVGKFFDRKNDFSGMTLEAAGEKLFGAVCAAIPELAHQRAVTKLYLCAVSLAIQYDGSLDHPTQRMEFIRSL